MCLLRFAQTVNFWRNVGKTYTHVIFNDKSGSVLRLHICECEKRTMTTFRNPLADPLGTRRGPQFENRCPIRHRRTDGRTDERAKVRPTYLGRPHNNRHRKLTVD